MQIVPISSTRTLYDYTAQTEEELSFSADLTVEIFDKDDPDWFLVRVIGTGHDSEYGFVPSNYLDDGEVESAAKLPSVLPAIRPDSLDERRPLTPPPQEEASSPEPISPSNAVHLICYTSLIMVDDCVWPARATLYNSRPYHGRKIQDLASRRNRFPQT
jgi:hypothetical protein